MVSRNRLRLALVVSLAASTLTSWATARANTAQTVMRGRVATEFGLSDCVLLPR